MARSLTLKQEKFVQGLLKGLSQRAAYKAAYDGKNMLDKTVDERACVTLKKPLVAARYAELKAKLAERNMVTIERVVQEYARLAFFDPRKLFNANGTPKTLSELDDDTAAAIAGLEVSEIWEGFGEDRRYVGDLKKYKIANKIGALDSIGKHLGMFIERKEITGKDRGPIELALSDADKMDLIRKVASDDGD